MAFTDEVAPASTTNFSGLVPLKVEVPIATLPLLLTRTRSVLLVIIGRSWLEIVPNVWVEVLVLPPCSHPGLVLDAFSENTCQLEPSLKKVTERVPPII